MDVARAVLPAVARLLLPCLLLAAALTAAALLVTASAAQAAPLADDVVPGETAGAVPAEATPPGLASLEPVLPESASPRPASPEPVRAEPAPPEQASPEPAAPTAPAPEAAPMVKQAPDPDDAVSAAVTATHDAAPDGAGPRLETVRETSQAATEPAQSDPAEAAVHTVGQAVRDVEKALSDVPLAGEATDRTRLAEPLENVASDVRGATHEAATTISAHVDATEGIIDAAAHADASPVRQAVGPLLDELPGDLQAPAPQRTAQDTWRSAPYHRPVPAPDALLEGSAVDIGVRAHAEHRSPVVSHPRDDAHARGVGLDGARSPLPAGIGGGAGGAGSGVGGGWAAELPGAWAVPAASGRQRTAGSSSDPLTGRTMEPGFSPD